MSNLYSYKEADITLPPVGVVLITGENGAGKSALPEGVALAFWGKTIRDDSPWEGEHQVVEVAANEATAQRRSEKQRRKLVWALPGETDWREFDTAKMAQEALERRIGPFTLWRYTSVFTQDDALKFSMATDAERKRFLEAMLGIAYIDAALALARADKKTHQHALEQSSHRRALVGQELKGVEEHVASARDGLQLVVPDIDVEAVRGQVENLNALLRACASDLSETRAAIRRESGRGGEAEGQARIYRQQLARFRDGNCPTCEQPIPAGRIDAIKQNVAKHAAAAQNEKEAARLTISQFKQQEADILAEQTTLATKANGLVGKLTEHGNVMRTRAHHEQVIARSEERLETLRGELVTLGEDIEEAGREVGILTAVEQLLGLKGVRAHVLSSALNGISELANAWLERIGKTGQKIQLEEYGETKRGSRKDAISLKCWSAAKERWRDYRALSRGEKRRVDVALVLALAEVGRAARGRTRGTLWFDEVFDALDADGVEKVAEAIHDLGSDRCVVVISHNDELIERLSPDKHFRIKSGNVY